MAEDITVTINDDPINVEVQGELNWNALTGKPTNFVYEDDIGTMAALDFWYGTEAEYLLILSPDDNTLYFIIEE